MLTINLNKSEIIQTKYMRQSHFLSNGIDSPDSVLETLGILVTFKKSRDLYHNNFEISM